MNIRNLTDLDDIIPFIRKSTNLEDSLNNVLLSLMTELDLLREYKNMSEEAILSLQEKITEQENTIEFLKKGVTIRSL